MSLIQVQTGSIERIESIVLNGSNVPVTGATVNLRIRRKSDNKFFDGSGFVTGAVDIAMAELDSVNAPGEYYYVFDMTNFPAETYYARINCSTAANMPQTAEIRVGEWIDTLIAKGGSAGGGFFMGAPDLYWSPEEKNEMISHIRKMAFSISELQDNQQRMAEVIDAVVGKIRDLDSLTNESKLITEKAIASVAVSKDDIQSIVEKSFQLVAELNKEKSDQVLRASQVVRALEARIQEVRELLSETQTRNQRRLDDITEWIKNNSDQLDTIFSLSLKQAKTDDLQVLISEATGGENEQEEPK